MKRYLCRAAGQLIVILSVLTGCGGGDSSGATNSGNTNTNNTTSNVTVVSSVSSSVTPSSNAASSLAASSVSNAPCTDYSKFVGDWVNAAGDDFFSIRANNTIKDQFATPSLGPDALGILEYDVVSCSSNALTLKPTRAAILYTKNSADAFDKNPAQNPNDFNWSSTVAPYVLSGNSLTVTIDGFANVLTKGVSASRASSVSSAVSSRKGILLGGAIQGNPLNLTNAVSTLVGAVDPSGKIRYGSDNGTGIPPTFNSPYGITTDGTNLFVADSGNGNIRKIVMATGVVSTFAGNANNIGYMDGTGTAASFGGLRGIISDGTNLFVADAGNNAIRKIVIATGVVTTLAGNGTRGFSDGIGSAARFYEPVGITSDGINLYVTDNGNHLIRKIVIATGAVTTLSGKPGAIGGLRDGTGTGALFNYPLGITNDGTNLFVADTGNRVIRKILIATGAVTTLAVKSSTGSSQAAKLDCPVGIIIDGTYLFVTNGGDITHTGCSNSSTIHSVDIVTGEYTTIAGDPTIQFPGNIDGVGKAASFVSPSGITAVGTNLFVSDATTNTIRKIDIARSLVTTFAGTSYAIGSKDGVGIPARFGGQTDVTTDGKNLFVIDRANHSIRKVDIATRTVTTLAGLGTDTGYHSGILTTLEQTPFGITTDGSNLFISDPRTRTIRKIIIATGAISTFAGKEGVVGGLDGIGSAASFDYPTSITTDGINLFVMDGVKIRKIVMATGAVTTFAGTIFGGGSALYINNTGITTHITTDGTNLFLADGVKGVIRKIVIATGSTSGMTILAGSEGSYGYRVDGIGAVARFSTLMGITTDGTNLFVTDAYDVSISKVVIATGVVTTIAGGSSLVDPQGTKEAIGKAASFFDPQSITTDGTNLFVGQHGTIRAIK